MVARICKGKSDDQDKREENNIDGSHAGMPSHRYRQMPISNSERWFLGLKETKAANEHMHKAAAGRTKHTLLLGLRSSREIVFPALRILFSLN